MRLTRTPFYLPINEENKRKNSSIFLLTPNLESSINTMRHPLAINKNLFESYYIEKDISFVLNENSELIRNDMVPLYEAVDCLTEMSYAERKKLPNSAFGLPKDRKYPMADSHSVHSAIKLFGHCPEEKRPELAKNIVKAAKKYNVHISDDAMVMRYVDNKPIIENAILLEQEEAIVETDYTFLKDDSYVVHEDFVDAKLDVNNKYKIFFGDAVERIIKEENSPNYSMQLRKILYSERIKNQKECSIIHGKVKQELPLIKYTYINYALYKEKNLFVDWSYYTQTFFKNNIYKLDKGVDLFFTFLSRFLDDTRINDAGYKVKTVFIPIKDWAKPDTVLWDYTKDINPISMIYRMFKHKTSDNLKSKWGDHTFVFMGDNAYFKLNFNDFTDKNLPMFISLISKLNTNDVNDADFDAKDSSKVITHNIIDNIEKSGIEINNLTGKAEEKPDIAQIVVVGSDADTKDKDAREKEVEKAKTDLVKHVKDVSDRSSDENNAMDNLNSDVDSEWLKQTIIDLQSDGGPNINNARKARMDKLRQDFLNTKIKNSKIEDIIKVNGANKDLPTDNIPIKSINEEWKNVKFTSFNKEYNLEADIYNTLISLNDKSNPIAIIDIKKEDSSTSEDYIETWIIKCEDINGKRFTLKIDIPKFINNRFMKLRGNLKVLNGQLVLLPIIKTDEDTAQIVSSSYNKIFIRRVNPSNGSKTTRSSSMLTKFLKKYDGKAIKITEGDNSFTCAKYELPIEFRDLAGLYNAIGFKDGSYITFDMDDLMSKKLAKDNIATECRYYVNSKGEAETTPNVADSIIAKIIEYEPEAFTGIKPDKRLSYSEASILNTDIPVIVVMSYSEGLQTAMSKANIKFTFQEKRPSPSEAYIKFEDGYIVYEDSPSASLLMSGLSSCNTEDYSIKEINKKEMWLDFLDNFGGRIKADGLDNFYDCMFTPITVEICESYHLPTDYVTALAYASDLLIDTKYNKHVDISGNRVRTNEIVASYVDKSIAKAYGDYRNQLKRNKKDASMTIKQSAVIDAILTDNTCSDLSVLNPQLEGEAANTLSFKGLSGMNSDRSYSLDKRTYDESMFGVLAASTGFAANVGITRQATIDSSVKGVRGMIVSPKKENINTLNALSIHEALNPFSTTHDDPIRTAMGFVQATKHQMRVKKSHPNLVTTGMDEALPYMTSDIFSYKFKGKRGKVLEVTDSYIIFQDLDTKENDYVDLRETIMKNSDGGFFVTVKLDSKVKAGQSLKNNDILAYDKSSFSDAVGNSKEDGNISYNAGTLAKIAILPTDEGYEDSAIIDDYLSDALTSTYCVKKERGLSKDTNVYNMVKKGDPIEEGDPLLIFQNAFEEKDANALLRSITDDDIEAVSDLGRIQLRSKLTGYVQDIKIYRTCELDELSPSLKKIVSEYEKTIKKDKELFKKNNIKGAEYLLEPDYKLAQNGKLKGVNNGVLIEFYIKCIDKMGIGDKLVYNNAIKGVVKKTMSSGEEPTSTFRPKEPVNSLLTTSAVNARMVSSIILNGSMNKGLIELDRKCKELLGIKWKNLNEM